MTVKALMPVRQMNLVMPLAHEATDRRITETTARAQVGSGAVSPLIDASLLRGDVNSMTSRRPGHALPGTRISRTATRTTTTTCRLRVLSEPSADSSPCSFEELLLAYLDCRANKRSTPNALAFEARLERELFGLHAELCSGQYRPGRAVCFVVTRPRPREVWASGFRDRIVHHLLYNRISPRFHARFIVDSCACIPGRGTLYAAERLGRGVRSITQNWHVPGYYLKCDLANFFVSINKSVLFDQLARQVPPGWWRELVRTVLFHDPRTDVEVRGRPERLALVPTHKSLFNAPMDTGLPIGNLSSQFFANVHLDALDQFVKHRLRAPWYVRYVDDFVLLHESAQTLNAWLAAIASFLPERLGARLNDGKTILQPVSRGIDFVGQVIKPWRRTTRRRTLAVALERIKTLPADQLHVVGNSYLGTVRQATHSYADRVALCRALLKRGHTVEGLHLSKIFRRGMA